MSASDPLPPLPPELLDLLRNDLVSAATVISLQAQALKAAAERDASLSGPELAEVAERIERNLRPILAALTVLTSAIAADRDADRDNPAMQRPPGGSHR